MASMKIIRMNMYTVIYLHFYVLSSNFEHVRNFLFEGFAFDSGLSDSPIAKIS